MGRTPDSAPVSPSEWLLRLQLGLRRPHGRSVLLLADGAAPAVLAILLRALLAEHPDTYVVQEPTELDRVPEGCVVILLPRLEDIAWLNLHRPLFSRRGLRVIFFCTTEQSAALHLRAPDLFDWITYSVTCPEMPPPHAVAGLRALLRNRRMGCIYPDESYAEALVTAFPGRPVLSLSAEDSYESLLDQMRAARRSILVFHSAGSTTRISKVRWALAELGWRRPSLIIGTYVPSPGWWLIHGKYMSFIEAVSVLPNELRAGRLAALLGFEAEAVQLAASLLQAGHGWQELEGVLLEATDPGAAVARFAANNSAIDWHEVLTGAAPAPHLRGLWNQAFSHVQAVTEDVELLLWAARLDPLPSRSLTLASAYVTDPAAPLAAEVLLRQQQPPHRTLLPEDTRWLQDVALECKLWDIAAHFSSTPSADFAISVSSPKLATAQSLLIQNTQLRRAEDLLLQTLNLRSQLLGRKHILTAEAEWEIGNLYLVTAEFDEAERHLANALSIFDDSKCFVAAAGAQASLGVVLLAKARYADAKTALERALGLLNSPSSAGGTQARWQVAAAASRLRLLVVSPGLTLPLPSKLALLRSVARLWLTLRQGDGPFWDIQITESVNPSDLEDCLAGYRPQILYLTHQTTPMWAPENLNGPATAATPSAPVIDPPASGSAPADFYELLARHSNDLYLAILEPGKDAEEAQRIADAVGTAVVLPAPMEGTGLSLTALMQSIKAGQPLATAIERMKHQLGVAALQVHHRNLMRLYHERAAFNL